MMSMRRCFFIPSPPLPPLGAWPRKETLAEHEEQKPRDTNACASDAAQDASNKDEEP